MKSHLLRRTLKFGPTMGYLAASAAGCFLFTRGFQLIAKDGEESDMRSNAPAVGRSPKLWAGKDAALFLMAFVASEALMTIMALRH
jgi:hypothetical protein